MGVKFPGKKRYIRLEWALMNINMECEQVIQACFLPTRCALPEEFLPDGEEDSDAFISCLRTCLHSPF